jgi:murein DD-endopeptidase MepM/ murein hydrolase activator NlpD
MLLFLCVLAATPDPRAWGRSAQLEFEAGDQALWTRLSPSMQKVFGGSVEKMKQSLAETRALNGAELRVVEEVEQALPDGFIYARRMKFEKNYVQFIWTFDRDGKVVGLMRKGLPPDPLGGEAPTKFLDYQTKTQLHLPFQGAWKIVWGGHTLAENHHAWTHDQRFAYDISKGGDGKRNQDYACFGQPLLAPAAGKIAEAVDGIADNVPGVMPTDAPCGNHVVIDHGNGEFSHLCHFQKGSLAVKLGASVAAGALLGRCGNSGHSSEPHLHYHLQNAAGEGLPAQFLDYLADGKPVARGEPMRGQTVERR